ncbi:class I adenylate-forming enzyme family protein [Ottowia sp.]|mgnify:CR=1 FL=1|uniref:class I adenylate-forming enzyme family protein n=1 Tax=Ottowia sp. TaxID=1898956 RepID=UPI002CCEFA4C|nr:class I adenylate-forming enzyme family protein [Ottowia sp.]HRN76822.1 class I adenylate-forming enzyme family protein [Ottowia sp.]HRQ03897.1 class I adenylate-forming enzyme family protein [Ottowia sp.]
MNIVDPIHRHALAKPDRPAVITSRGTLSWAGLDRMLWSAAKMLHDRGLRAGDRVGLKMIDPVPQLIVFLALARIGVAHVVMPFAGDDKARRSLQERLAIAMILCDSEAVHSTIPGSMLIDRLVMNDVDRPDQLRLRVDAGDLPWLVIQSSGTTGAPKFAELTHARSFQQLDNFAAVLPCSGDDIFWPASRLDFLMAKRQTLFCLQQGAAVYLPASNLISEQLVRELSEKRITLACGTPSHLYQLIGVGQPLPALRAFDARSATIGEELRREFKSRISRGLYVIYGTSEAGVLTCAAPDDQSAMPNTVGAAVGSVELEIVDERGALLAPGLTGEVRVKSPAIIESYLDDPEATGRSFKGGWFYPGDLGYLTNDGALVLQGRRDDMMIFDGMNIFPAEIENALRSHHAVREAAAFAVNHWRFQDVPVAAVTLRGRVSEQELVEHCGRILGFRNPLRIWIIKDFPRNPMGKILKRELVRHLVQSGKK